MNAQLAESLQHLGPSATISVARNTHARESQAVETVTCDFSELAGIASDKPLRWLSPQRKTTGEMPQ